MIGQKRINLLRNLKGRLRSQSHRCKPLIKKPKAKTREKSILRGGEKSTMSNVPESQDYIMSTGFRDVVYV